MLMYHKAFLTDSILELDAVALPTVVTAKRFESGRLAIYIAPTDPPSGLCGLLITITSNDLREVQRLLGEERPMCSSADDEGVLPGEDIAWHALRQIADLDQVQVNDGLTWKEIAMRCIDYAQEALDRFEEGRDGTPSDS